MGNCAFAGGDGPSSPTIKVVTPDGGVMELDAPVTAELITAAFPGYAIFPNRDLSSSPLLHTDNLAAGELYNLLPLTTRAASITLLPSVTAPYRVSFDRHAALFSRRLKTEAYSPAMAAGVWKGGAGGDIGRGNEDGGAYREREGDDDVCRRWIVGFNGDGVGSAELLEQPEDFVGESWF
ncbi:uncharacterized protein LOC110019519 isoform X2 [Phalaenopsis equestris]|uniref:uncharacterized protein LOC110019519 isoform X2 n=1 Tax=Phalaenopsis equestris TaxID=78828 RepID=UPI0009E4E89C|nr:uncharacterized protein LOC110019519 isoform X2 [Phalaenopsis equestris]